MFNMKQLRTLIMVILTALLTACALPVKQQTLEFIAPPDWDEATGQTTLLLERNWWSSFNSAELERLIAETLTDSPDIRIATERVLQAEIALRHSRAPLFPTLNLDATTRTGRSETSDSSIRTESSRAGLFISYEIDVWRTNIAAWQGGKASFAASRYDYQATRLSLIAGVANAYWQILAIRDRLAIARRNLDIAEGLFAIVEARQRYGAATALDLSRQRTAVMIQRDALLPLEMQERQSLRALALLVGKPPQGFTVTGDGLDQVVVPAVAPFLPAELLLRRPDIAAAEERLVAASANIYVARAALFPLKLNLGLSSLLSSSEFAFLGLGSPVHSADAIVSLTRALFDGGRLRGQVAARESEQRVLVENWRKVVLTSLKEVDDALAVVHRSQVQEQTQREIRDETAHALTLSELRYKEGSDGLTTLLDAQRSLFSVEDQLIQQKLSRLSATVDLYKALGGGWQLER
jgi:NodT family efflux transporter outer membrane factor (OMF) lipoprotein